MQHMTRETKVGLVVGTGIILLIGIIVSDHLAAANRGSASVPAPPGYVEAAGANGQPRVINPRGYQRPEDPITEQRVAPIPPAENLNPNRAQQNPTHIEIAQVDPGNNSANSRVINPGNAPRTFNPPANNNGAPTNTTGTTPGQPTLNTGGDRNLNNFLRTQGVLDEGNTGNNSNPNNTLTLNHNPTGNNNPTNGNGNTVTVVPSARQPEPIIHYVQPGERLWTIAEKYYGNGKHWTIIAQSNADKMVDARQGIVRENVRLVIPHKSVVLPEATNTAAGNDNTTANNAGDEDHTRIGVGNTLSVRTVKVESGDNLTRIAERYYRSNDYAYVKAIVEANRDQIRDADDIKAGMLLKMPDVRTTHAAPARTSASDSTTADPREAQRAAAAGKTYTAQSGDTLSEVARKKLGDFRRWHEIYELNKSQMSGPNALREGMVLVLPADAR